MGASKEDLPLGAACSGLLLLIFVFIRSSHQLLLVVARNGSTEGFPFLFETVLLIPLAMQTLVYAGQTFKDFGLKKGMTKVCAAASQMGPCAFYSIFIVVTNVLETYCLQFIPASLYIVLKQLAMVVIAIAEVILFAARPSLVAWLLIVGQAVCVALFQCSSVEATNDADSTMNSTSSFTLGVVACLVSSVTGGLGNTLQQRFFQSQAKGVSLNVKLFYQHLFALVFLVAGLFARHESRDFLWREGFFGGWNRWTVVVCCNKWFRFYSASAISAYISAIAGAFAGAVSVALTGILEFLILGRAFSPQEFVLMGMVCVIAVLYTQERMRVLSGKDVSSKKTVSDDADAPQDVAEKLEPTLHPLRKETLRARAENDSKIANDKILSDEIIRTNHANSPVNLNRQHME